MAEITTTKSMKGPQGQYCSICREKKPVGRLSSKGFVCTDCDWRPVLVERAKSE